jgi:hypothetical protein
MALALVLLAMVTHDALGTDFTGTGPDFAMSPSTGWVELQSGQLDWYAFDYKFDEKYGPLEVKLYSEPPEAAVLTMRNGEQANLWRQQGKHEHFGCCTPVERDANKDGKGDYAVWAGHLGASGKYFMVVERAANVSGPASYKIEVNGKGYTPAGVAVPEAEACCPVEEAKPVVVLPGTGPDLALEMPKGEVSLNAGEYHWYYFDYKRDSKTKDEDLKPIEIKFFSNPAGAAGITLRNAENAEAWRQDGTHEHFGCCSPVDIDKDKDGKADYTVWKGVLPASGRYYVVVEHTRNNTVPVNYQMEVSGL